MLDNEPAIRVGGLSGLPTKTELRKGNSSVREQSSQYRACVNTSQVASQQPRNSRRSRRRRCERLGPLCLSKEQFCKPKGSCNLSLRSAGLHLEQPSSMLYVDIAVNVTQIGRRVSRFTGPKIAHHKGIPTRSSYLASRRWYNSGLNPGNVADAVGFYYL
jgi:hypothetical protein